MTDVEEPSGQPARAKRRRAAPTPLQQAVALLSRREHSRRELERKLVARGVAADAAAAAVRRLAEDGWQDDARFAAALVRARAASGYGPAYVRAELSTHGVPAELIDQALKEIDDWADVARDLVRRRHPQALTGDREARNRAAALLLRRGFDMDLVRAAWCPTD
ncbi:regulatory protein RecX [Thermomonas hydrothermalis]|uniref:Regulatory protein RecX n=1 Tax=Thermomonas hydrothermalis TaxID=213588 RepID=A0A1M4T3G4_9GAMM|nr:regulatory protein RecX [Thermomonas hydrothermalis]MCL6618322.1 recombination regulator RecX [Thermomonas hydrothermalis]SHE38837.1 regulatory protein [Thermomonas hydrothermalis]